MNDIDKIMELIITDAEIARYLFMFDYIPEDVKLWTGLEEDSLDFSNIRWLFKTDLDFFSLVGVNMIDNSVWCIDVEGDFHQDCDALQNLPYEFIQTGCYYTEQKTVEAYYQKYEGYAIADTLLRYEEWCNNNDILLDVHNNYHDLDFNLFERVEDS